MFQVPGKTRTQPTKTWPDIRDFGFRDCQASLQRNRRTKQVANTSSKLNVSSATLQNQVHTKLSKTSFPTKALKVELPNRSSKTQASKPKLLRSERKGFKSIMLTNFRNDRTKSEAQALGIKNFPNQKFKRKLLWTFPVHPSYSPVIKKRKQNKVI